MVKVRFDIVVATFIIFILVILGNGFVNINKSFYESADKKETIIGYPASDEAIAVTTMEELVMATEYGYSFAIVTDSDKVKKTNYYSQLNGSEKIEKQFAFSIWLNRALNGAYYDRLYIVELEDGNRIPVLMMDGVVDMSKDVVALPLGEVEFLSDKPQYLKELNKKYELSEYVDEQWYVNASGDEMTIFSDYTKKVDALKTINWTIIGVSFALYSIISTILMVKGRMKNAGSVHVSAS